MVSESDFLAFVAGVLDVSTNEITMDSEQNDVEQWDSMGHLRLIMEVQGEYGVQIPLVDFKAIRTVRDLYSRVVSK